MCTVSPLLPADFEAAYTVEQLSFSPNWGRELFFSNQGKVYYNLKIECQEVMIGFAMSQVVLAEATLLNCAILPEHRRKGYGKTLLSSMIDGLQKKGAVSLWLEVQIDNYGAIALYHSMGFVEVYVRAGYYPSNSGAWKDALIMTLTAQCK